MWPETLLKHPVRIFCIFLFLLALGAYSFYHMPVSLFPNSTKPSIYTYIPFGQYTQTEFIDAFGKNIESSLLKIETRSCNVDKVEANYRRNNADIKTYFSWGNDGAECQKEVQQVVQNFYAMWPDEIRDYAYSYIDQSNTGFYLGSFYSTETPPDKLYQLLRQILHPKLKQIAAINELEITNPAQKKVIITLDPIKLAELGMTPTELISTIQTATKTQQTGIFTSYSSQIAFEIVGEAKSLEDIANIPLPGNDLLYTSLKNIATIEYTGYKAEDRIMKLNGNPAVLVYITPKPKKNIQQISADVQNIINQAYKDGDIPLDIKFKPIIDPGEIINNAIDNVIHEIWLCALIAVIVLFVFIGSFSNIFTTIIEIPTSIILSFILLKLTGVEINLISLGGLALSVGMNVDASIVVIDAIIKATNKLGKEAPLSEIRAKVAQAVKDVTVPLVLATISSLVVFIPLYFTSDLTYAILGDLALAVIYSHTLSLVVALFLVPTVRIYMIKKFGLKVAANNEGKRGFLTIIYNAYHGSLIKFITSKSLPVVTIVIIMIALVGAIYFIPTNLNKQIIAKPETAIIGGMVSINKNSSIQETAQDVDNLVAEILAKYSTSVDYVYTEVNSMYDGFIAIVLKNSDLYKSTIDKLDKDAAANTSFNVNYFPFNPSELPIPNMPDWQLGFTGNSENINGIANDFYFSMLENDVVSNINTYIDFLNTPMRSIAITPNFNILNKLQQEGVKYSLQDINLLFELAITNKRIARIDVENELTDVLLTMDEQYKNNMDSVLSLPIESGINYIPLRSVVSIASKPQTLLKTRINGEEVYRFNGWYNGEEYKNYRATTAKINNFIRDYKADNKDILREKSVSINLQDAKQDLTKALKELTVAMLLSLILIFLTLYIRFNSLVYTGIIMLAIPFGILGVLLSLWIFNSSISLNSGLGVILLNGISVANSILLVELILKKSATMSIEDAISVTAKERIAPILMTSLTTVLGMLPIAMGYGAGGTVLQPMGIAVCGGLWVSLIFTLYVVPYCMYRVMVKN